MSTVQSLHSPEEAATAYLETSPLTIRKILMATDLSDSSTLAAKYAARLAKQLQCKLELLHIVPPEVYVARPVLLSAELQKAEIARGRADLHEFAVKIPELRTLQHQERVLCGPTTELIIDTADERSADLIVMGSHGRSGITKLVMGSIAEQVIRHSHRPVLVVGPRCERRYTALRSVLLAADLPAGSLRAAQYAASIAFQSGAEITITHVLPTQADLADASVERSTRGALLSLVPRNGPAKQINIEVTRGDVAGEILRIANEHRSGLIVIGPKDRAVFADHAPGAILSKLISEARCPVLAVTPHLC